MQTDPPVYCVCRGQASVRDLVYQGKT